MQELPVRLGLMLPMSGIVGIYGPEISRAARLACDEINEGGGILGRPLEIAMEDDRSDPESAVVAAERLLDEGGCVALVGNLLSNARIAVAYRVAEPRRVPYLNFSFYEGSILSRYFFHFAALPNQQIDRMIPYMCERFGRRMFFAGNSYEWPRGSVDAAKRALERAGGEVVGEDYFPLDASRVEIQRLIESVAASGADVFVPYFAGYDQIKLLSAFAERGLKDRVAVVMGHFDEQLASRLPGTAREGFYSCNTYFMSVDGEVNRNLLARLATMPHVSGLWPQGDGILTNFGEATYLCVKAFATAANQAASLDPEALVETLAQLQLSRPQGIVTMDATLHHAAVNCYLARCQADGSFEIVERFAPVPPKLPERYRHLRVSSRAKLEEDIRLQARIVEQMTEGILLVDTQASTILYTNPYLDRLLGYDAGELVGLTLAALDCSPANERELDRDAINRILYRKGVWRGEVRRRRKDGSTLCCAVSITMFTHHRHGEVWMAVHKDITEIKIRERQLEQARREADLAKRTLAESDKMRALGQLAGGVAHDFNNLLTGIMGFAGLLQKRLVDPTQVKFADRIIQASRQASDLIANLLTFARRGSFVASPVDVHEVIRDASDLLHHMLPKSIAIELDLKADTAVVHGDASQLQAVLINLAVNARDAMKGDGLLRIATRTLAPNPSACPVLADHAPAQRQLEIRVADNGCGMTPEVVRRAFEPFFSTKAAKGAGLGLANVYGTIKVHRGDISIASKAGEGTLFRIVMPLLTKESVGERQAVAMESRELPPARCILLLDDEAVVVEAITAQLEALGCRVVTFTRGMEAVAWFQQHAASVDAVVLDLDMPERSGSQVFFELRQIRPDARIVLISGLGDVGIAQKLLDAGARSLLRKPFVAADLEAHLASALR